jgi:hydroxymethylpyrimidine pyrophosphatase-like HAD family hydrolase
MKISFDYDGTLSTQKGTQMAIDFLSKGKDVYIISARHLKAGMIKKAQQLGIPLSRVYATGSNENKISKIKSLGISEHYDNNENVIKKLDGIGRIFNQ